MAKQHTIERYYNFDYIDLGYSEKLLMREWELIKTLNHDYAAQNHHNRLIKQFQFKEFYKKEIQLWRNNPMHKGVPLRSWIFLNRKKYIHKGYGELTQEEIMRAFKISGIHYGNSFHSPFYIKKFCLDHGIKTVYDPCGGWGHRMLGAVAAGCKYLYNDINPTTTNNCRMLAAFLNIENNVIFSNNDSSAYSPDIECDAVFTCPPYHNIEIYSDKGAENLPYQDFLIWWESTIKCCLNTKCKYFAFIINRTYENDMTDVAKNLGLQQIECHLLNSPKSHLALDKQNYEKLYIFEPYSF